MWKIKTNWKMFITTLFLGWWWWSSTLMKVVIGKNANPTRVYLWENELLKSMSIVWSSAGIEIKPGAPLGVALASPLLSLSLSVLRKKFLKMHWELSQCRNKLWLSWLCASNPPEHFIVSRSQNRKPAINPSILVTEFCHV